MEGVWRTMIVKLWEVGGAFSFSSAAMEHSWIYALSLADLAM